jgi:hypothetical protein
MRKFCEFTKEMGEAVWVNPLRIRLVYASHAGSLLGSILLCLALFFSNSVNMLFTIRRKSA